MISPDFFSEEEAANRFDDALRQQLGDVETPPAPAAWQTLRAQLPVARPPGAAPPPAPSAWRARLGTFGGGVVVGALLWWGSGQLLPAEPTAAAGAAVRNNVRPAENSVLSAGYDAPIAGNSVPSAGYGVLVAGDVVPSAGYGVPIADDVARSAGYSVPIAGDVVPSAGYGVPIAGDVVPSAGYGVPIAGDVARSAGYSVPIAGDIVHSAGYDVSIAGNSVDSVKYDALVVDNVVHSAGYDALVADNTVHSAEYGVPGAESNAPRAGSLIPHVASAATVEARDSLIGREARAYLTPLAHPADTARTARLRALVQAQTRALARLTATLDSVKQFLPEAPPALLALLAAADTTSPLRTLPPSHSPKWAALLLAETTPSWALLPTRNPQAATQEQTVAVLSQQLLAQRQLTPRWAVRAGVGLTTLTTQARTVAEKTSIRQVIDSTETVVVGGYGSTTTVVTIVRRDSLLILEPKLNGSGQIDYYDSTWVPRNDTIRSIVTTTIYDTLRTKVITSRQETLRERQTQLFRPVYRFWTLPVAVRYTVLTAPRWTLGAVLGGQVSVFRGGTRPVLVGDHYEARAIGPREGPYRPVSLSLSAGLEAEYRLSPRLRALVAPSVRWWALSAARTGGSGPRPLLPAATVGLVWGF